MSAFIDFSQAVDKLGSRVMTTLKEILKLPITTSGARLRAVTGIVKVEMDLVRRLLSAIVRYEEYFGESPRDFYLDSVRRLCGEEISRRFSVFQIGDIKKLAKEITNLARLQDREEIGIRDGNGEVRDQIMASYDLRSHWCMRFFCDIGWFRGKFKEKCVFCDEIADREHVTETCPKFSKSRMETANIINAALGRGESPLTLDLLNEVMFGTIQKKVKGKLAEAISSYIFGIYSEAGKNMKIET